MLKYIIYFIVITVIGILYDKYKTKQELSENKANIDLIRKYLLNDDAISGNKPIIWVHINYETNSRQWLSFGSRNSRRLNQPYLYITLQSIINHSVNDFNVCLIDDDSFSKLIPGWSIDLHSLADPVKSHIRNLALSKVLYYYGGMNVPVSYLAIQPMKYLYDVGMNNKNIFVVESNPQSNVSTYVTSFPTHTFMGCSKQHPVMKNIMLYLERLDSRDYTNEQDFLGQINRYYFEQMHNNTINKVDGTLIGTKTTDNKPIYIDELMGASYINFVNNLHGILIPQKQLLERIKFGWFVRMSPEQIYNANTILSKYMVISNKN